MKRCVCLALLLPILAGSGCGNKDLILSIDLLSYVDPAFVTTTYGPVAAGIPTVEVDLLAVEANLLEGIGEATELKSATLRVGAVFVNAAGSASGSLKILIASADTPNPFNTTPVADLPVLLQPAHTTTISEEIPVAPEHLQVLTSDAAWFAVRITSSTEGSPGDLMGVVTLTELTAVLVTETDL